VSTSRRLLGGIALLSLVALGIALVSQHAFGMQPCPWCIFQRVLYLAMALLGLAAWLLPPRALTMVGALGIAALAAGGVASAVFQHQVAARDSSCAFTLADRFLNATGLESAVPWLFQVTATCVDAAEARLLGLGFEVWSGLLFGLFVLVALAALIAPGRGRARR
jgi:disulfide bond formation protein DsbB